MAPQPMWLTKCLASSLAEYDASGWESDCRGPGHPLWGQREECDERRRARGPEKEPKGLGLQRLGGLSPDVPNGSPWDNRGPQGILLIDHYKIRTFFPLQFILTE